MKTEHEPNMDDYIASLSDQTLIDKMEVAWADLKEAAEKQNQSEWHQSCFAACVMFAKEMGKRGLKRSTPAKEGE
jgi:hypothetical protein